MPDPSRLPRAAAAPAETRPPSRISATRLPPPPRETSGAGDPVRTVLAKVADVAVLPQVVCQIMALTGSDEASAAHLERAIVVDPGFSVKLLAQANSAYYALPRKIVSIRESVLFLGFREVRQLAMTVGVFDLFVGKTDRESLRRRGWWKHSLDTAVCCRALADSIEGVDPDAAYTCGLLHLVGKTLLDRFNPAEYERAQTVIDQGAPELLAERAVFGCDHIAVGLEAASRWRFPEALIAGLDYFHPTDDSQPESRLRAATALATKVVKMRALDAVPPDRKAELLPAWAVEALALDPSTVGSTIERLETALDSANRQTFH